MSFENQFPNETTLIDYIDDNKPLNIIDSNGDSLLIFACTKKYSDAALKILIHPAEQINLSYSSIYSNTTALLEACKNDLVDVIDKMLEFNAEEIVLNFKNDDNESAISVLCNDKTIMNENNKTVLSIKMIQKFALEIDLSIQNKDGNTPLMLAIMSKLLSVANEMLDRFNAKELNLDAINKKGDDAEALADNENLYEIIQSIRYVYRQQMMEEDEENIHIPTRNQDDNSQNNNSEDDNSQDGSENSELDVKQQFKQGKMPPVPSFDKQIININEEGYDPIMMENVNVKSYLDDEEDNIAIKINGKVYLSSRENLKRQINDALVFECVEADIKLPNNIVSNLPLYNLKMIGINVESEQVGTIPEYIYYHSSGNEDGIEDVIYGEEGQLFSIIPLHDKMLVSVISWNELQRLGTGFSGASAVHCQAGQGGLTGIIVKAFSSTGGYKNNKNKKTKRNIKNMRNIRNKSKKQTKKIKISHKKSSHKKTLKVKKLNHKKHKKTLKTKKRNNKKH